MSPLTGRCDVGGGTEISYLKVSIPPGYSLLSDPLDDAAVNSIWNTIGDALSGDLPTGLNVSKLLGTNYVESQFDGSIWSDDTVPFAPGAGARLYNPGTNTLNITMSGGTLQGSQKHYIPAGRSLRAGFFPRDGLVSKALGFPLLPGVKLYSLDPVAGEFLLAESDGQKWLPNEPVLVVAQAVIVESPQAFVWEEARPAGFPAGRHPVHLSSKVTQYTLHVGEPLDLSVSATAAVPLRYQWQKDGETIVGAIAPTFSIASASLSDSGTYWVRVSSDDDSAWSELITVKVIAPEIPLLSIVTNPLGSLYVHAAATPGGNLVFESSNDFVKWTTFRTQSNPTGTLDIPVETDLPAKFIRASRQ